jgi:SAM-dependent methyltransferase
MGEHSGWQIAGTAPEMMERYIGPAFATTYEELVVLAALHGGERVLDVACGTGGVTRRVAQVVGAGGQVVGVDVNEGVLSMARTVPQRHDGPPIAWHHSDAAALPFPDAAFDVVLCQYGLEFFANRAAGLREMARVLVPGGRLVLRVWAGTGAATLLRGAARGAGAPCAHWGSRADPRSLYVGGYGRAACPCGWCGVSSGPHPHYDQFDPVSLP